MQRRSRRGTFQNRLSEDYSDKLNFEALEDRRMLAVIGGFELLKDINPTHAPVGSRPSEFVELDGLAYFIANTATHGAELWRSDGTAAGTILVKDINSGSKGGFLNSSSNRAQLTAVDGVLFFQAYAPALGFELWKSDGTAAGTKIVKDIAPGEHSGVPAYNSEVRAANINGALLFAAGNAETGVELWRSDGTPEGTALVKDIRPGADSSNLRDFTVVGDTLFFRANDGAVGYELWKSDGTAAGTILVKDIFLGSSASLPRALSASFASLNGLLYFAASSETGIDLWRSDGTNDGTALVKDLESNTFLAIQELTEAGGRLYFASGAQLWTSDGTTEGTTSIRAFSDRTNREIRELTNFQGQLFFFANDGSTGSELWKSDGTVAGTVLVRDIRPGREGSLGNYASYSANFTVVGQTLYFAASVRSSGVELWKTDGTSIGTELVKDIHPGVTSGIYSNPALGTLLINIAGTLFFRAKDENTGFELWKSNGLTDGTTLIKEIRSGTADSGVYSFTAVGQTIYFAANDGVHGHELWKTDGTAAGTVLVKDLRPNGSSYPWNFVELNGLLYFTANNGTAGQELWRSDGTPEGTRMVVDIHPGSWGSSPTGMANIGGVLYFSANGQGTGEELWRSDGTASGTVLVKDINPGTVGSRPNSLIDVNGTAYFRAYHPDAGYELWRSDGTASGTSLVNDIWQGTGSSRPSELTRLGDAILFFANDGVVGSELWRSDGTSSGTVLVRDTAPGSANSYGRDLTAIGDGVFFFAPSEDESVAGLWRTDGTAAGTILIRHADSAGLSWSYGARPGVAGGNLYYTGESSAGGDELWVSDGTFAGTKPAHEFVLGSGGSAPRAVFQHGNQVFVSVITEEYGRESWVGEITPDLLGDFDVDGDVDGADFLLWQRRFGSEVNAPGSREDASGDGYVDSVDMALMMLNFGVQETARMAESSEAVTVQPALPRQSNLDIAREAAYATLAYMPNEEPLSKFRLLRRRGAVR